MTFFVKSTTRDHQCCDMAEKLACLKRLGENIKKFKLIILEDKDEFTIGRSPDVTICLMSTMISRCHAVLKKKQDGRWTVRDNKSLNGVLVNNEKLEPNVPAILKDGDIVQIGMPKAADEPAEFIFQYYDALKVKRKRCDEPDGSTHSKKTRRGAVNEAEAIRNLPRVPTLPSSDSQVTSSQPDLGVESPPVPGTSTSGHRGSASSPYRDYKQKLAEQEQLARQKIKGFEEKLAEMQRLLQEKDCAQTEMKQELENEKKKLESEAKLVKEKMSSELKEKEARFKKELIEKQKKLAKEKEEMERKMKEELQEKLKQKEETLLEQLSNKQKALQEEKCKVEQKLQEEMTRKLESKDKHLEDELLKQKERLEKVIANKELEQKLLESQLTDVRAEKDKQQEEMLHARDDVLSNFAELMETELQCSICNELFVQATSLNCSHGYCSLCISQWMKLKKECPVCRAPITSYLRSIVLDSYIETMVEHLSEELKKRRKELVESRKEEQKKFDEENQPQPAARGRGRGRGRGGRGRGRGSSGAQVAALAPAPTSDPITVNSDSSSIADSDDSDSMNLRDSSEIEDSDYGDHGACFVCGAHGHWARSCPYR